MLLMNSGIRALDPNPDGVDRPTGTGGPTQSEWVGFHECAIADGMINEEILAEHPDLEADDIAECLRFAALAAQERGLPLRQPA